MRLATLARRTTALTASVALLTTGGAATGLLGGVANAVGTPFVGSAAPNAAFNTATSTITINGTGFIPAEDTVRFVPTFAAQPGGALVGTVSAKPNVQTSTPTALSVAVPLTMVAPGAYDIIVDQADVTTTSSAPCPKCFSVTSVGPATSTKVVRGALPSNSARTGNVLDISGTNFAKGAGVRFLNQDCSVDPKLAFTVNNGDNAAATGGYPSTSLLQGDYTAGANFTPGRHFLLVTNTDGKTPVGDCSAGAVDFYQPYFLASGVAPASLGAGSANQTITVTGQGFRQGSTMTVQNLNGGGCNGGSDAQTGTSTVSTNGTTISAPVTLQDTCNGNSSAKVSLAGRSVTVRGPDGAVYAVANAFTATAPPTVTSLNKSALGRGGSLDVTVTGSGFVGGANPTVFSFGGGGVTGVTKTVLSSTQALVTVVAASDAVLGGRSVTATNSDLGTSTLGPSGIPSTYPLTIDAAPVSTNIAPASTGKGSSVNVVVTGTGFDGTNGMNVTFSGTGVLPGTVTVTKGNNGAADTATFQVNVDANALAGLRDVVFTNKGDSGSSTCTACFGVDSLAITPAADGNTNNASNVTLTGQNMTSGGSVSLLRPGADPSTAITAPTNYVSTTQSTATLNLLNEAPGKYNVTYSGTSDNVPLTCASCFTITGQTPTFTSITPAQGGQGALNLPFTVKGTKFAKGSQVTIAGATVHDVAFVDPQTLTGQVDIPAGATTGAANVKVVTADGSLSSNTGTFTINAGPVVKTITPTAVGQGAKAVTVTVKGTGFVTAGTGEAGSQLDLGPGISISNVVVTQGAAAPPADDTLTATIDVAQGAATGARNVVVTNSDAGRGVLSGQFTVDVGPVVSSISPSVLARGAANQAITVVGTGFAPNATLTVDGLTFSSAPTVSSDGTTITGNGSVAADATRGAKDVVVTNPTDKGLGTCPSCFTIADLPGAPTIRSTTPGVTSVTVSWSPPADNGGSAITQYTLSADDGTSATSVAGDQTSATLNGLTGGHAYTLTLTAQNAEGVGPGATTTATPYDVPLAPTAVSAKGGSGYVDVTWSGEDARGSDITEYTVRYSTGSAAAEQVVTAPASGTRISNLVNGTTYTFTVKAKNAAGYGAFSSASATAAATYVARLTSNRSPVIAVSRGAVTYSGRLTRSDGTGIGGAAVSVLLTPEIGGRRTVGVTTAADGTWSFRFAPTYNTTVAASFAGDAQDAPVAAPRYKQSVRTRVVRQSPATGQTTRASSTLAVKGYATPNKSGRTIGLYEGTRLIAHATVASNGYFTINVRLPRGTHTVHIGIGATSGNAAGDSGNFVVKRS